ncbi:MAG: SDR family oxidoreductase [Pseudomonadales bacterium]|jgi:3-oxoacyl-[acyl-carrier protein] reductase|nr:SDR family oxidoreductase [Pseudomonadales bacterium]
MDLQLTGHRALVTGAHRGTGEVIARRLAEEGAAVLVHGFERADAERVAATIPGARAVAGDLMDDAGADAVWAEATAEGPVTILVNNYGRAARGTLDAPTADWLRMYEENVLSAARLVRHALPAMRTAGWGRIVNLGTVGSTRPNAENPHYYAAKGALATLTVSLAKAAAGSGVTVNLVSPGLVRTEEVEAWLRAQAAERGWGDRWEEIEHAAVAERFPNPVGRLARREEIADVVCFLASPRAGFVHGQNLRVDGGAVDVVG